MIRHRIGTLVHSSLPWRFISSWYESVGTNNTRTPPYYWHASNPRIPGLYLIQGIDRIKMADVLTVLKWRTIKTLNRKLLEKTDSIEPLWFLWGTHSSLFYHVNATVSFWKRLTLCIFRFQNVSLNWQTDRQNRLLNPFAQGRAG